MSDSVYPPFPSQPPVPPNMAPVISDGASRAFAKGAPLFNSASVSLATFLGTPVAGSSLLALNYRRMGETSNAVVAVALGVVATGLAIGLGFALPEGVNLPIGVGLLIGMRVAAEKLQGPTVARHVSLGGKLGSKWTAAGIGLVFLCLIYGGIIYPIYASTTHSKVTIGTKDEVFYSGTATKEDAQSLGNALKKGEYFKDRGTSVFLEKGKDGTTISMVLQNGRWNDPGMLAIEEEAAREVADSVGGLPIHVKLIDQHETVQKQGIVGRASANGKDEVFYFGNATEAEALALCRALADEQYFGGRGASVMLSKDSDGNVISFVVSEGYWNDEAHVEGFKAVVRAVASSVGGLPLKLRLVNTSLEEKKVVVVQ